VAGLPAYFLGKQGVRDAMFLPEINKSPSFLPMQISIRYLQFWQSADKNIRGLRNSSEELIPLFLNKIVQLTV
jgi:hypothetical protein